MNRRAGCGERGSNEQMANFKLIGIKAASLVETAAFHRAPPNRRILCGGRTPQKMEM